MLSIIVAFPKMEDARNIKNVLIRNGYDVENVCSSGAQAISYANELDGGIVVSGYRFTDMYYYELNNYLPKGFEMLLIASASKIDDSTNNNIMSLSMPIKLNDLINTIQMMTYNYNKRKKKEKDKPKLRTEEEKAIIFKAKALLMERNNMTEEEAHRYIQKNSMDSGTNMIEMAHMILSMM